MLYNRLKETTDRRERVLIYTMCSYDELCDLYVKADSDIYFGYIPESLYHEIRDEFRQSFHEKEEWD